MIANKVVAQDTGLLSSWNYAKNSKYGLDPNMITASSTKKAYWNCDKCHGCYDMRVCDRSNGHGCPYCRGMRVLEGYNDLASQRPDLLGF